MKRFIKTLLALIPCALLCSMLFACGGSEAQNEQSAPHLASEGLEFTSFGNGTCYVSGIGRCSDAKIYIPEVSPNGDSVTAIGDEAFLGIKTITEVTVPERITSIGIRAFKGCNALQRIEFSSPGGWCRSRTLSEGAHTVTDLTNPTQNARHFSDAYDDYYWYKR